MNGSRRKNGKDWRGSAANRRARRDWLYSLWRIPRTAYVPCFHCGVKMRKKTFHVDRYPVPGHLGGRYVRSNIVPSCERCNVTRNCVKVSNEVLCEG